MYYMHIMANKQSLILKWQIVFSFVRFYWWSRWLWDSQGPWCWSLFGGGGEVCGGRSMPAVLGKLQLRGRASVSVPTRFETAQPFTRAPSGNSTQGQHTHPRSVPGRPATLPSAHTPLTGEPHVNTCFFHTFWNVGSLQLLSQVSAQITHSFTHDCKKQFRPRSVRKCSDFRQNFDGENLTVVVFVSARAPPWWGDWSSGAAAAESGPSSSPTADLQHTGRVSSPQQLLQVPEPSLW